MMKLNALSVISTAIFLSFPIYAQSAPLSIFANSTKGNVDTEVMPEDEIEQIFVMGDVFSGEKYSAKIAGTSINIIANKKNTMAVGAQNGVIMIGGENSEKINIQDPYDSTVAISSQGGSLISLAAKDIYIQGNESSRGVKAENFSTLEIGSDKTNSVEIWSGNSAVYASDSDVSILAKNISLSNSPLDGVEESERNTVTLITKSGSSTLVIGDENTDSVNISSTVTDGAAIYLVRGTNSDVGPNAKINGKNIVINAVNGVGIWMQNNTESAKRPAGAAQLTVNAENFKIDASQGILAYSNSSVDIVGNTEINSEFAIVARGNSLVNINTACSTCKTVINGDVAFMTTKAPGNTDNSGALIDAEVNLNLSGVDSKWNGRAYQTFPGDSGEMIEVVDIDNGNSYHGNVTKFAVNLSDGAQWNVTGSSFVNNVEASNGASVNVQETPSTAGSSKELNIGSLTLDNGVLNVADAQSTVAIGTLAGKGEVLLKVGEQDGQLVAGTVTAKDATNTELSVNVTGANADDFESADSAIEFLNSKVSADGALVNKYVEEGDIKGAISETGGTVSQLANTKLTDFSSVNAMSLVQWRNEINHLTKRLGDIRASEGTIGAWARVYGGESQWGGAHEVEMDHTTIQVGGDYRINNHWIAGAAFSYTDSRADLSNGDADGDSYSLAVYGTYTADGGSFLDVIGRYGYLKNDITAGNMALDTSSSAFSLSAEMGHTFRFINDAAYVEPQIEFTYGFIGGDDATASNGVRIDQDDFQSFVTRVGVRAGYDFPQKKGSVYGMFSYSYDWMGDADGTASKDGLRQALSQDLGGGWGTYGVGAQIMLGDSAYFYGELERTSGGDIDNPYQFSAGVRMTF